MHEGIKGYSGLATYRASFDLPRADALNRPMCLDVGVVKEMAQESTAKAWGWRGVRRGG